MNNAGVTGQLRAIVGDAHVLTQAADCAAYLTDWRGNYTGIAQAVVRPGSTEEVAAVVRLCAATRTPVVPQGGNTGMVGGSVPDASGRAIVLSLRRLNRIRHIDVANDAMTVEAGCILQAIQDAADRVDRFFPLSLAAEGSCTIGGNLSTNAGGTAVLRYGNARDLVLGIEAVTPAGDIWNGLKALRKDNTGYDLKHLLMGAEGTLGIITAAVLKLFPKPRCTCTALVALADPQAAVALLSRIRSALGDRLVGFELMSRICLERVIEQFPATVEPFDRPHPWQVLVELADTWNGTALDEALAAALEPALACGAVEDALIASSGAQAQALWAIRENIPEAEKRRGKSVKHDIALPVSAIAQFIARADAALADAFPSGEIICFGHVGDGNLHYNLSLPGGAPSAEQTRQANGLVYALIDALHGSISAEHGLGQLKREEIARHKAAVELDLMRAIKHALDPQGIMNPGKGAA
ncbi:MAG TPA: FAD-binding oxidoreductase [Usitatibacteraceae bacterium]|nr:FAD-binding oxidoreductase [Usitatibacteraceae bacterium]